MNENDGGVTVPSVIESTSVEGTAEKTLIGNFGGEEKGQVEEGDFVGGDRGEIVVEVVGSDVFVDRVGGEEGSERKVEGSDDLGKDSLANEGVSGDLKLEEVVDHSSQVWDALMENGDGNVDQGEVMVDEKSLDVGEELTNDERDGEAKKLGTEIGVGAAEVNSGPASREAENVSEEVDVSESVGVIDRGLADEGGRDSRSGDGEANLQDSVTSGQDNAFDDEAGRPAIDEAPNNVSLRLVGGIVGEVNAECADKESFGEGGKVAAVPSVAIDTEISVSVSLGHHADIDEPLAIENKEVGCSVANIDNVEDQEPKDDVGESSKVDVQTQYATTSEVAATESKVLNSMVEVLTTSDIGSFIASSKEFENVKCEKEISGNVDEHGDVAAGQKSTLEEAFADGGDDAGMDIDEVINWKDDVLGNTAFGGTVSGLGEDDHLKLKVEKVLGSSEIEVTQAIHIADGSDVALRELENTNFEVQEETNGNDVDYEPMKLDYLKGDLSLSVVGENAMASAQLAGIENASTDQLDVGISVENILVAKEEMTVMDDKNDFDSKSVIMQEEKQVIVLQQDGTGSLEVNVRSDVGTFLCTDISETHSLDAVTSNDTIKQDTVAKDESSEGKSESHMQAHILEVKSLGFSDSEPIMHNRALDMDACPHEEGTWTSQGAGDNEIISLQVETKCVEDDGGNIENTVELQVLESRDGSERGDSTAIGSISGQEIEVEEGYTLGEQEPETQLQTSEAENLISIDDEEVPELSDPVASSPAHQSLYLQPPENEGKFSVSDLVWGKVRSHPWWPGQIFDPADASEKALKYHKKDSFLVAYFGDRTFAWNDAAVLKPFRTHFSQVQKHNNSEVFRHAVRCALEEVSRRVELGLACSCIPQDSYDKIKFQVVENTGIKEESSRRSGVDKSAAVSSFEPKKLLDYVRALARSPYDGTDQLELVIAKAQLSSFSRYKGYPQLPEFHNSGELLENDDISEFIEAIEYPASACKEEEEVLVDDSFSQKRKRSMMDSVYPNKKEKNLSDFMVDIPSSTDGEDGLDGKGTSKSVSTAGKKRRAIESFPDGSDKSKSSHSAKVSSATSPTPKPSFKIGECIRRAASQLTGSPSSLKCSNEKFLKIDGDEDQPTGFEVSVQTPGTSPRGRINTATDQSSVYEMLSQLHLAAQDPMKGYSFLSTIIPFFSSYRTSVVSKSRRHNSSTGRPGAARKRKASNDAGSTPEEFEFDDVNDSYWTDRIIQNYSEEQLLHDGQNGVVVHQPVVLERKKKVKSGRKTNSRKRFSNSVYEIQTVEPEEPHVDLRKQDLPTELVLNFAVGVSIPPEMNLNKTFKRFGPLMESETEVDRQGSRAKVVFKNCSDAEVAYSSAGKFNIFGAKVVNYELNYSPVVSYKPLPLPTLEAPDGATL